MKRILFLALVAAIYTAICTTACTHTPPKTQYQWVSLSSQDYTQNTLTVNKESTAFYNDKGFSDLEQKRLKIAEAGATAPFPLKKNQLQKIVLIGDTGCRLKEGKDFKVYQNCADPTDWTYPSVAKKIAQEKADLIIHVGDYHYRENCSQGEPCQKMTTTIGPGWKSWEADFFQPSIPAFAAAPWIFVRGNHEDCHRAFEGYKILTDQTWDQNCIDHEKTEYIDLGDILIVQFDTSTVSDKEDKFEDQSFWDRQFKDVEDSLKNVQGKHIWFVTHKPLIGLVEDRHNNKLHTGNIYLQKAFAKTHLADKIEVLIAGHIHTSQFVRVPHFPPQLVVGNGGTALDEFSAFRHPEKIKGSKVDGLQIEEFLTDTENAKSFGYAVLTRPLDKSGPWTVEFRDIEGKKTFEKEIP